MDKETKNALNRVVLDRSGLRGKKTWTDSEAARFNRELEKMPGEFRELIRQEAAVTSDTNLLISKKCGIPIEIMMRMIYAGNEPYLRHRVHSESDLAKPVPGIPGNTFGVEMVYSSITPT